MTQAPTTSTRVPARATIGLVAQVLTCLAFCVIAAPIIYFSRTVPLAVFTRPLAPLWQLLAGQGLALVAAVASYAMFRYTAGSAATARTIARYQRLDLRGMNPLWIALAAAIGEEMLFRAALQPLLGLWLASLVFLVTHVPVYRFRRLDKPALAQVATVFGGSVALGLVFDHVGFIAAVLVHLWVDIVGLLIVRAAVKSE
jgi:uncharacterized protein